MNPEGTLADFLQEISLYADVDSLERKRAAGHPHDPPQRQGPRVPRGVHHRDGRGAVPSLALSGRAAPRGGAKALLRGHHPRPGQPLSLVCPLSYASRRRGVQDAQPVSQRDPRSVQASSLGATAGAAPAPATGVVTPRQETGAAQGPDRAIAPRGRQPLPERKCRRGPSQPVTRSSTPSSEKVWSSASSPGGSSACSFRGPGSRSDCYSSTLRFGAFSRSRISRRPSLIRPSVNLPA